MRSDHASQSPRDVHLATVYFLLHTALLTAALAISGLFFNLAILALGFDRLLLGALTSVAVLGAALLGLPLWWLTSRIALRTALLLNALAQAAGLLVLALAPGQWTLLLVSGATGAATVLYQLGAQPLMLQLAEGPARDRIFSQQQAILIGGAGLGALIGGGLPEALGALAGVTDAAGRYRLTFGLAGVLALLSLLPLLGIPAQTTPRGNAATQATQDGEQGTSRTALRALRDLIPQRWMWLRLLTPPLVVSLGAALLVPYLNLFFVERFALGDAALGTLFALISVGTGAVTLAAPRLAARLGRLRTLVLTEALGLLFLIGLGLAVSPPLAAAAALLRAALFNMARPLYEAYALEQVPAPQRTLMVAGLGAAQSAGFVIAPLLSVQIQAAYGFGPVFALTTGLYALAVALEYWWFVRGRGQV